MSTYFLSDILRLTNDADRVSPTTSVVTDYRATSNEGPRDWFDVHGQAKSIARNLTHTENQPKERYWQQK